MRITAAEALVELGDAEAGLPVLVELLDDKREYVALHAANSLECIGDAAKPVAKAIAQRAKNSNNYVERATSYTAEKLAN